MKFWKVAKRGEFRRAWRTAPEIQSPSRQISPAPEGLPKPAQVIARTPGALGTAKHSSRQGVGRIGRNLALFAAAICFWSSVAEATQPVDDNSHTFSCAQGYSGHLCKAGGSATCISADGNDVDNLNITGVTAGSQITFNFTAASSVSTDIEVTGQGQTGNPSPSTVTVPPSPQSMSYIVLPRDGTQSDFHVAVKTTPNKKAAANYTVSCKPATGTVTLRKTTQDGRDESEFVCKLELYAATDAAGRAGDHEDGPHDQLHHDRS